MLKVNQERVALLTSTFLLNINTVTENGLHIIIAEDNQDDARIISESFKKHKAFSLISTVRNGEELIVFLHNNKTKLPNIILTDISMPLINGLEALDEIFKDAELRKIPAFVYSSTLDHAYDKKGKELGVIGYLIKPLILSAFDEIPYQLIHALKQRRII